MTEAALADAGFAAKYGPWALVIGGSDGLGAAFARLAAASGLNCLIVARRLAVLDALAAELRADFGVETRTASIDLANADAADQLAQAAAGLDLGLVIFNAGAEASGHRFVDAPLAEWQAVTRRNIDTFTASLHHFAGALAAKGSGGIVIVGSIASLGGVPRAAMYTATKGYALNLGESLWAELKPRGVDVLTLVFNVADTPLLRSVLARQGIPVEAANATPPDVLARATLDQLANGPTFLWQFEPDGPDSLTSAGRRRERVVEQGGYLEGFYGSGA